MNTKIFLSMFADVRSTPIGALNIKDATFAIGVLDYLKYGTLGLAGIILWFAYRLYYQANSLNKDDLMKRAQSGISNYMAVAKWLLIPCLILQVLSIITNGLTTYYTPRVGPPPEHHDVTIPESPRVVKATIRLPPLRKGDGDRYGEADFKVYHNREWSKAQKLHDEEYPIEVSNNDTILVDIDDVIRLFKLSKKDDLPPQAPTQLH